MPSFRDLQRVPQSNPDVLCYGWFGATPGGALLKVLRLAAGAIAVSLFGLWLRPGNFAQHLAEVLSGRTGLFAACFGMLIFATRLHGWTIHRGKRVLAPWASLLGLVFPRRTQSLDGYSRVLILQEPETASSTFRYSVALEQVAQEHGTQKPIWISHASAWILARLLAEDVASFLGLPLVERNAAGEEVVRTTLREELAQDRAVIVDPGPPPPAAQLRIERHPQQLVLRIFRPRWTPVSALFFVIAVTFELCACFWPGVPLEPRIALTIVGQGFIVVAFLSRGPIWRLELGAHSLAVTPTWGFGPRRAVFALEGIIDVGISPPRFRRDQSLLHRDLGGPRQPDEPIFIRSANSHVAFGAHLTGEEKVWILRLLRHFVACGDRDRVESQAQ